MTARHLFVLAFLLFARAEDISEASLLEDQSELNGTAVDSKFSCYAEKVRPPEITFNKKHR